MIIFLREKFIAQLFMAVIAVVFIIGTVMLYSNSQGGGEDPGAEVVLRIDNAEVTRENFENAVANEMRSRRNQRFGGEPDREETQKSVIERWIQETILGSAQISDAEVERYIRSDANLVTQYNRFHALGYANSYTDSVRLQLSAARLRDNIQALELVTDTETEQAYRLEADKAKVKFIEFKHSDYGISINIEDTEAEAYFQKNREDYKTEEQVNVKFIKVVSANFVEHAEVETYYQENPGEFTTPEAVKARHILKKFPDNATDEQKAEVKIASEELLKTINEELAAGATFAELAEKYSEGPSASRGGSLRGNNPKLPPGDYFARGDMVKPFEEACFDRLSPGQVSELVETTYGYHIIQLEEKKNPETQPFDLVQSEIRQKLVKIRGVEAAKELANDLLYEIEIQDYDAAIAHQKYEPLSLTVQETGLFSRDVSNIPNIGSVWSYRGLIDELFDLEVNVRKVVEGKNVRGDVEAYFIATVLEKKPVTIPPFAEVKTEVVEALREEKAKKWAFEDAQKLFDEYANLQNERTLEALLKNYKTPEGLAADRLSVQESSLFGLSRSSSYVAGIGNSTEVMFAAFKMDKDEVRGPFKGDTAVYIIQLVEREEADLAMFATDTDEKIRHRQAIIQTKKREAYLNWFAARKKLTKPWIHPEYR